MPEKGGQDRQAPLHILSGAIPLNQSLDRKAVAEVMKAWAMAGARRPQSSSLGEGIERPPDSTGFQPCSCSGYEEERSRPSSQESGTMCRVVAEHSLGSMYEWARNETCQTSYFEQQECPPLNPHLRSAFLITRPTYGGAKTRMPHGPRPTLIFATTVPARRSTTDTSLEGPLAA
jgi:hypothetical protein